MYQDNNDGLLSNKDIMTSMRQMGIPITEENLIRPTTQSIKVWFEAFIEILKGVTQENIRENFEEQIIELTDYPQSHGEDVLFMSFYKQVRTLLMEIGVDDFTLADIVRPDPQRTRRFLGEACNFAMFRDERMPIIEKYMAKDEKLLQRNQELIKEIAEIEEQINKIKQKRKDEESAVQEGIQENSKMKALLMEIKDKCENASTKLSNLSKKKNSLEEKVEKMRKSVSDKTSELNYLKARIVHSPEKVQMEIDELERSIIRINQEILDTENYNAKRGSRIEMFNELVVELGKRIDQVNECIENIDKNKSYEKKVAELNEAVASLQRDIKDGEIQKEHLSIQVNNFNETGDLLRKRKEEKGQSLNKKIGELRKTKLINENRLMEIQKSVDTLKNSAREFKNQSNEIKARIANNIGDINANYDELLKQVMKYQQGILMILAQHISQLQD
ncbi:hypothetical protein BB558_000600 [Smittium angustum]|uniref:Uncharacterized protein n=1 Tax=Smittium angustum TaxID=133377 RepID=A0A2U1JE36_SMIAN|nr:hypothetical protein BB558_000600 [Smittium angustum]